MAARRDRPTDPLQALREMIDSGERLLNELLSERSAEGDVSALRSRLADASMDAQRRFRDGWGRTFQTINLPTRTDVIRLGKRIAEVEDGVARIEAQLRRIERVVAPDARPDASAGGGARPKRTRQPASRPDAG